MIREGKLLGEEIPVCIEMKSFATFTITVVRKLSKTLCRRSYRILNDETDFQDIKRFIALLIFGNFYFISQYTATLSSVKLYDQSCFSRP